MHPLVAELVDLLSLERIEDNVFRGQSRDIGTRRVFGGQVLGQAASAAQQTVTADRTLHSLHAYFLRAGDVEHPIVYQVESSRDGGSFSVRRVTAIQHGQPIFVASASFQREEDGLSHQMSGPDVPQPEDIAPPAPLSAEALAALPAKTQRWLNRSGPFEFRPVYPRDELNPAKRPPHNQVWVRLVDGVGDDPNLHRALLTYEGLPKAMLDSPLYLASIGGGLHACLDLCKVEGSVRHRIQSRAEGKVEYEFEWQSPR